MMRRIVMGVLAVVLVSLLVGPTAAHKEKLPEDARTLVQQAAALLAQDPAMTDEVEERLEAALKSSKPEGVHVDQVAQAMRALESKDVASARRLLTEAIMPAGMPMPPVDLRRNVSTAPPAATITPSLPSAQPSSPPSVEVAMKMAEPLRSRFTRTASEDLLLAAALMLIAVGLASLWRARDVVRE